MKKKWMLLLVCLVVALANGVPARAAADDNRSVVTVAFGIGLNTAIPNNPPNHHVLPRIIRVKRGGVVNFVVSGLHQIYIYQPGTKRDDLVVPPGPFFFNPLSATNTNIIDTTTFFYQGIVPAGGPLGLPVTTNPSNAVNRVEAVSFPNKGTYLVICNVRPHLLDGMFAYVRVGNDDEDDEDDEGK